jgi:hypothetical protein
MRLSGRLPTYRQERRRNVRANCGRERVDARGLNEMVRDLLGRAFMGAKQKPRDCPGLVCVLPELRTESISFLLNAPAKQTQCTEAGGEEWKRSRSSYRG